MNTENNKRFQDNSQTLIMTMLRLMEWNDYKTITVSRLCKAAKLHRSTFYAHFKDIHALVEEIHVFHLSELESSYQQYSGTVLSLEEQIHIYLKHTREHHYFYRVLYGEQHIKASKSDRKDTFIWIRFVKPLCDRKGVSPEYETALSCFFHSGLVALMQRWLNNNCDTDTATLAAMIVDFIPATLRTE